MAEGTSTASKRETTFLDLNDDCLMDVFSWMSLLDLCAVRSSCSRLKKLTENYFGRKHKRLEISSSTVKGITGSQDWGMRKEELMKLLSSFGQQIDVLTVDAHCTSFHELYLLDEFCKTHSLEHLKLVRFNFGEEFIRSRSHPFPNVEKLTLDSCSRGWIVTDSLDNLIRKCTTLKNLELLGGTKVDESFLEQTYPMLQKLNLNSIDIFDPENLKTFFTMNPQLEDLSIVNCCELDGGIFQVIGDHLCEVESLTLRPKKNSLHYNARMMDLLKLPKLRKLEVDCNYRENVAFLSGLSRKKQLESLGLASIELTEDMSNALGQLKSVKELKLVSIRAGNSGSIQSIAAQLPLLKQFYVSTSDSVTFDDIVKLVENAPKLEDLMITKCWCIIPFEEAQFNRLVGTCAKRTDKLKLTMHFDCGDSISLKRAIRGKMRRNNSEVVSFVELPKEAQDFTALDEEESNDYFDLEREFWSSGEDGDDNNRDEHWLLWD